jgi:Dynamin GTPase effector domain
MCQAFANSLQKTLVETLFSDEDASAEKRKQLVSEDPRVIAERERLEARRLRLKEIKSKLDGSASWMYNSSPPEPEAQWPEDYSLPDDRAEESYARPGVALSAQPSPSFTPRSRSSSLRSERPGPVFAEENLPASPSPFGFAMESPIEESDRNRLSIFSSKKKKVKKGKALLLG